ncbi:MAG: hemerythrin domain-containing protein [Planctomycetes bacterium]|nr:hemerythrin domain-containing protein [Planctomycetota bacterium]
MNSKPKPAQMRQQILDDHRQIGELLSKVAAATSAAETLASLQPLQPLLQRHFKEEEDEIDGLHGTIMQQAPQHANALLGLKDEHRQLLESVQHLLDLAHKGDDPRLRELGQLLKGQLAAHETRETEIFVDSIWTDLGAGD